MEVRLTHKYSINIHAYVDSGASHTFVPQRYAKLAGLLDEGNAVKVQHIEGSYEARMVAVRSMEIMRGQEVFENMRGQTVLVGESDIQFCILGRNSVFRYFDITFSEKRRRVTLTRV